ncbi:MAG: 50S ribosomal protein L11 methyltransferase [Firmicutes bacterium]|nr:50S ribosomal protein L11 methyltransferase [[Eubacterium] siraeum]MCM1489089.1 50S ribosomal protein L11 methyltransferase [Bacillota bacterium]
MEFKKIDIYTESEAVYPLTMMISELGINGFEIHDSADFEDFLENKEMNWDYVDDDLMNLKNVRTHITCYLQENVQGMEMLASLKGALADIKGRDREGFFGSLEIKTDSICEEDWANNWKQYYKPFNVGKKLIIKPTWENVENTGERKILEIDPASSFGTGQHHTTKLVMEALEDVISGGEAILDLGCGSGILSIAALLLGAEKAVMTDVFLNAVNTACENVEQNGYGKEHYSAYCGNIIDDKGLREKIGTGYDVITANIVADVIIKMCPLFRGFLKDKGKLIVSGIITERLDEVKAALSENGIKIKKITEEEGWNAILCDV